jgi:alkanesulfonate monooxygenase SsuD/methylene tetrahydromethanopterin reductase-like flavin-dependent oxidoreductase (luciferase family)
MKISAAFPPVPATPEHIGLAEKLGYSTAWVYDTPALQLDCWMTLALAAARTRRIRLAPHSPRARRHDPVAAPPHGDSLGHRHASLARR